MIIAGGCFAPSVKRNLFRGLCRYNYIFAEQEIACHLTWSSPSLIASFMPLL